jgi:hypothetical protein
MINCRFDSMIAIKMPAIEKPKKKRERVKPLAFIPKLIETSLSGIRFQLPIHTVSEANNFDPWKKKHLRHKAQHKAIWEAFYPYRPFIKLPCTIKMTRVAPKSLDVFENLPMSMKYIVDAVCTELTGERRAGLADSDERITMISPASQTVWKENRESYGVIIEINF